MRELYGFRFADVTLEFPDYDTQEEEMAVILDTLTTEAPALTHEQNEQLFRNMLEDYADIPLKADRMKKVREDTYYNALQVKFGYAVTCHKAQGGQWAHVYLDQGYMTDEMLTPDYIHWLYTAFTRASEKPPLLVPQSIFILSTGRRHRWRSLKIPENERHPAAGDTGSKRSGTDVPVLGNMIPDAWERPSRPVGKSGICSRREHGSLSGRSAQDVMFSQDFPVRTRYCHKT